MSKIKYIVGNAALDTAILSFSKKAASLQAQLHVLACSVLKHSIDHGDIRPMAKLIQAVPAGSRVKALCAWFDDFGPVMFDQDVPSYSKAKKATADLISAEADPFWTHTTEVAPKDFDLVKALTKLISRAEKDTAHDHSAIVAVLKAQLNAASATVTVQ